MCCERSKSFTSALMLVGKVDASKMLVRAMPDSPASSRRQTASIACPIGVIQPVPVMTTRFMTRDSIGERLAGRKGSEHRSREDASATAGPPAQRAFLGARLKLVAVLFRVRSRPHDGHPQSQAGD